MSSTAKIALVTGASRGIGEAIAKQLATDGMVVVGTATTTAGAEKIKATLQAAATPGFGVVLDVNDNDSVASLLDRVKAVAGDAPGLLVNNAGITRDNLLMRMKDDEWQTVIDTNLSAVFQLSKLCLKPMMKARWGRIINISSVVASMGNPGQANYAAAKAGMIGFSKSLAREIGSRNITVNVVSPGFIQTDMTATLDDKQRQALEDEIPLARLGSVEDIAAAVSFLASDRASYITGETLHVNGGMYLS